MKRFKTEPAELVSINSSTLQLLEIEIHEAL